MRVKGEGRSKESSFSAEASAETTTETAMVAQNHSRILAKSEFIRLRKNRSLTQTTRNQTGSGPRSQEPDARSHICSRLPSRDGSRFVSRRPQELVAHAADGLNQRAAGFQLAAQMADVHVDRTVEGRGLAVVQAFHQIVLGNHPAGALHQQLENVEFEGGQLDRLAVHQHLTGTRIEHHAVDLEPAGG